MFDYQSPITAKFCGSLNDEMIKFFEDTAHAEIKTTIGYNINKEELIKALAYDRHQYEKGYQDGKAEAERLNGWISVKDRLPKKETPELLFSAEGKVYYGSFDYSKFYAFDSSGIFAAFAAYEVSHWQYLPEPPEEVNEDDEP